MTKSPPGDRKRAKRKSYQRIRVLVPRSLKEENNPFEDPDPMGQIADIIDVGFEEKET